MVGPVSSITPPPTSGPEFGLTERQKEALIERQSAELVQLRNLNADLLAFAEHQQECDRFDRGRMCFTCDKLRRDALAKARGLS